jgi:hypothetical protein
MEVIKKKGIDKPKLVHNRKLFWIIIFLGILLIILIIFIIIDQTHKTKIPDNNITNISGNSECVNDGDCSPVCGCHPSSCVPVDKKGQCERMMCTMECSGPLDCGAGRCGCVNNKCSVINTAK